MKYMLDKGIYLKSDETKGYKIYPIYGSGHWTQTEWKKYITQIEEDNELTKSIIEFSFMNIADPTGVFHDNKDGDSTENLNYGQYNFKYTRKVALNDCTKITENNKKRTVTCVKEDGSKKVIEIDK